MGAICWIVPKKYLLLLDQTILLHFRSNIDRPLSGYLHIPVVITISVSRKKIYNQSLGAYEKNLFWMKWCLFYFYLTFVYITVTCRHTIVLYDKDCFSNIKTSSKRLEYLNILPSFSRNLTPRETQKIL